MICSVRRRSSGSGVAIFGQDDPLVKTEPLAAVIQRTQKEKPTFAKRQQDLLTLRYDLANRPAPGVTMSRGKAVQDGVRVKLAGGMTWEKLATMTPEEIKDQNAWPAGFFPLPHPHHESGGMVFPKLLIEEMKKQTAARSDRFDLDFDLPDHLLPDFPAAGSSWSRGPTSATSRRASSSRSTTSSGSSRTS